MGVVRTVAHHPAAPVRRPSSCRRQRGAAVIVAMLVVALAAMAASSFMFRSRVEWRRLENLTRLDQAHWVLRAAEQWGAAVLRDDARLSSVDHLGEVWAMQLPPVEAEGYQVSGRMEEQDGRFNLNNLVAGGKVNDAQLLIFTRLLRILRLPENLAVAAADWLDEDESPLNQDSAESAYYAGLSPPYRAANHPLVSVNELLGVKGFDRDVLAALRPFVTALPTGSAINVNTAPPEVLAAMVDGLGQAEAYAMAAKRERIYFRDLQDFQRALPDGLGPPDVTTSVSSQYFVVQARIRHERLAIGSQALFRRQGQGFPTFIWRAEL
jgi:general secretion pathway protein K